ncbi:MAG: DMT family transporter [Treponema sp.]|jgi:drug/metabolite transporter (DMT)-like permease|nr:DMT family transporter [Treponema sp.]
MIKFNSYHPFALITIFFWSLAYIFTRITIKYFSAFSLGFLRYFIAAFVLILVAIILKIKIPDKKDIKWFLLSGLSGFSLYVITFNKGCETVSASTSSIIIATVPVITALLARFFYKEKIRYSQYLAILIEFLGVIIVTTTNGTFTINTGIIWLLLAAFSLSIYNILQRKLTKKYTALRTTIYSIFIGEFLLFIFLPETIKEIKHIPIIQYFYIGFLGIFCSAIAYISWSTAISKAKETISVSNYMFLTPFLTTILGLIIINEKPEIQTIIGGIIILTGMFLYNSGKKHKGRKNSVRPNIA